MSHTPGPWYVSLTPDRDEEGWVGPEVYDRDLGVFAVLDGEPETIAQPWSEADARLIAAAPEMLEALERLVEECGPQIIEPDLALEFARAVIRKARGEM